MRRTVLGKTGLEVNRLGFGGIPIQRVGEDEAVEAVRYAIEKGIDFIDTARGYTNSEQRIGRALRETNRRVVLATKSQERTSEGMRIDIEKSLEALQRDYIDLYQCHFVKNQEDYEAVISPGGALEALSQAKEEGLIRHVGLSSHSLDLLDRVIEEGLFETIMVCFSFLEPAALERIIPKAVEKNIGVIAMKPFSGGVIEYPRLALKYVLSYPDIVIIPGMEHRDLVDENWDIFEGHGSLNDRERKDIEEIRNRFDKTFCRRCDYCQPCTEDIPIQMVLGLRTMKKRLGKDFLQRDMPRNTLEKARHCSECGECMTRCPYDLPIPDLIKETIAWADDQT